MDARVKQEYIEKLRKMNAAFTEEQFGKDLYRPMISENGGCFDKNPMPEPPVTPTKGDHPRYLLTKKDVSRVKEILDDPDFENLKNAFWEFANAGPEKIGDDVAITNPITEVAIVKGATSFVSEDGLQQKGAGAALTVNVVAPDGVYATNMIWAIRYTDAEGSKVKYTDSIDISNMGLGTTVTGNVQLGLAFLNGFNRAGEEIEAVAITDVDAIFLFSNNAELLTNKADADNKN